eukprot:CAMPEP_0184982538 /NCGR_PEP_ID=MMETSP1098-20130426/12000_1 /TAXON_ID=89044 /ORGANISM="Spumella elongata, Strain CCAP 955/1" /LENGTH=65 /DNA_ID=CAMNT_0027506255 /DNA_START=70 /DNA_END=267 /DNA_ORIENTATION=-
MNGHVVFLFLIDAAQTPVDQGNLRIGQFGILALDVRTQHFQRNLTGKVEIQLLNHLVNIARQRSL